MTLAINPWITSPARTDIPGRVYLMAGSEPFEPEPKEPPKTEPLPKSRRAKQPIASKKSYDRQRQYARAHYLKNRERILAANAAKRALRIVVPKFADLT
jgi:hypothetical protein